MSDLSNFLAADSVDAAMTVSNKKALFQQLATAAARKTSLRAKDIVVTLNERERLGSTGFGGGTAIPHGQIEGLDRMFGSFARLGAPIEFQAVDTSPVDLVFLLLSPPDPGANERAACVDTVCLYGYMVWLAVRL